VGSHAGRGVGVLRVVHQVDPDPIATSRVVGRAHACDVCGARVVRAHFLSLGRGRAGGWLRYGCCGSRPPGGYGLVRTTPAAAPAGRGDIGSIGGADMKRVLI
jgi:hypothetical protein